ncbi:MAG: pentapeptide repeat-containing protein, partial [Planctomycetales bacterium]
KAALIGANLKDCDLSGVKLQGADLTNAQILGASWAGAEYDENTVWPAGTDPQSLGASKIEKPEPQRKPWWKFWSK